MMVSTVKTQPIQDYDNYGYTPGSTLWIWNDPRLEEVPAGENVFHYKVWGFHFTEVLYRGRHDASRKVVSVFPPKDQIGRHTIIPGGLQAQLEVRFPESQIMVFDL